MIKFKSFIKNSFLYRFVKLLWINLFIIGRILDKQLINQNPKNNSKTYSGIKIFVPLIETNHYQFYQILIICKALQLRGAEVKILLCNSSLYGCEIKSVKNNKTAKCLECLMNDKLLIPKFQLDTIYIESLLGEVKFDNLANNILKNYPKEYFYKGVNIIPIVNDSVTRYYYGAVPDEDSGGLDSVRLKFIKTALISTECADAIERTWCPDITFGSMNVYCDWAPYHKLQKHNGKKVATLSITPFNYESVVINAVELYETPNRFNKWLKIRNNKFLTLNERDSLYSNLNERISGNIPAFKIHKFYEKKARLVDYLNIDKSKKNIFLFTNIYWDVGVSESGSLYNDVIVWVLETIRIVENNINVCLYIKTHPAEIYDSSTSLKGVKDFIFAEFPELPSNVFIVDPVWKLNTYDLFPHIDVGVVYNGTVGLEMMISGIPLIVTGKAPYSNIGVANEPSTNKQYTSMLLGGASLVKPIKSIVESFAYFYFIKSCIPWTLTKQAYGYHFEKFSIDNLDEILEGKDLILDHICDSIVKSEETLPESW